uniref:Phosphatidylglycerophosphatase n=1 Tax=uncultured Acidobacteria bacterium C5 TaxID=1036856 RepID=F8TTM6_9BACT|nr:phosphatidylglycerophosphatase [uncultured Acidobacteria bacterium C5]
MVYIIPALALLALTFVMPRVNPYRPPLFDLDGPIAIFAYYLTLSGAGNIAPLTATLIVLFLVARPGISFVRRIKEFVILWLIVFVIMQGWTFAEVRLKNMFQQPRPVIVGLATEPAAAPSLQMTLEDFYKLGENPNERRAQLAKILTPEFKTIPMDERIRVHWAGMTDYGFPSGHSVGAMMNAMFFLAMGLSYLSVRRMWLPHLVLVWSLLICYSRPTLREHSPTQVLAGGTIGICLALIAFMVARLLIARFVEPAESRSQATRLQHSAT